MSDFLDVRAVLLPPPFIEGLNRLIGRVCTGGTSQAIEQMAASSVLTLLGKEPTFGRLKLIREDDLVQAFVTHGMVPTSHVELREIATLIPMITPQTALCTHCRQVMLMNVGGKIVEIVQGALCPGCGRGVSEMVQIKLRKLAWTTGALVEPQAEVDGHSLRGGSLPLTDEGIIRWVGGRVHQELVRILEEERVPLYVFLAYEYLVRHAFRSPLEAPGILSEPQRFDLGTADALRAAVIEALAFGAEREIENGPQMSRLPFLLKHAHPELPTWQIADRRYLIEGQVGRGEACDVFRGHRVDGPIESVIIKVARGSEDGTHLAREHEALKAMESLAEVSAASTVYLRRIHQPVLRTTCPGTDGELRETLVLRHKPGFSWNLDEVRQEYPEGVPTHAFAWMMKRGIELLAWLHQISRAHGALIPAHLLVQARDHQLTFIDWSYAGRLGEPLVGVVSGAEAFYPSEVEIGAPLSRAADVATFFRSCIYAVGGNPATGKLPEVAHDEATQFAVDHAGYGGLRTLTDTYALYDAFSKAVKRAHGPARYIRFFLPRASV